MALYRYTADSDRFQSLFLEDRRLWDDLIPKLFSSEALVGSWTPIAFSVDSAPSEVVRKVQRAAPDLAKIRGNSPVFSARAWTQLQPLVEPSIEILPIECRTGEYVIIHVTDVVDCLDRKASRFKYYSDGGIMLVEEYVFDDRKVGGRHMFRIPETYGLDVIVSEQFVRETELHGLTGAIFERIGAESPGC